MAQVTAIIALSERLRKQSYKARNPAIIADLRLAICYLRALAALKVEQEVECEADPKRKVQLKAECEQLHSESTTSPETNVGGTARGAVKLAPLHPAG
jgi:hypothetical protein